MKDDEITPGKSVAFQKWYECPTSRINSALSSGNEAIASMTSGVIPEYQYGQSLQANMSF